MQRFLGVTAGNDTMTGKPLPDPGSISMSVLNGTGRSGQAGQTASAFQALGFNVVGSGDTSSAGSPSGVAAFGLAPALRSASTMAALPLVLAITRGTMP